MPTNRYLLANRPTGEIKKKKAPRTITCPSELLAELRLLMPDLEPDVSVSVKAREALSIRDPGEPERQRPGVVDVWVGVEADGRARRHVVSLAGLAGAELIAPDVLGLHISHWPVVLPVDGLPNVEPGPRGLAIGIQRVKGICCFC